LTNPPLVDSSTGSKVYIGKLTNHGIGSTTVPAQTAGNTELAGYLKIAGYEEITSTTYGYDDFLRLTDGSAKFTAGLLSGAGTGFIRSNGLYLYDTSAPAVPYFYALANGTIVSRGGAALGTNNTTYGWDTGFTLKDSAGSNVYFRMDSKAADLGIRATGYKFYDPTGVTPWLSLTGSGTITPGSGTFTITGNQQINGYGISTGPIIVGTGNSTYGWDTGILLKDTVGTNAYIRMDSKAGDIGFRALGYKFYETYGSTALLSMDNSGGVQLGAPTGGSKGNYTINVAGSVYKNGTEYTNPENISNQWLQSEAGKAVMEYIISLEKRIAQLEELLKNAEKK
jgi:hypothetical protein